MASSLYEFSNDSVRKMLTNAAHIFLYDILPFLVKFFLIFIVFLTKTFDFVMFNQIYSAARSQSGKTQTFELKNFVRKLKVEEAGMLRLELLHPHAEAGIGPREGIEKIFALNNEQAQQMRIVKNKSRAA